MVGSLTALIWLSLGAFAIGTEGFMIAGLLPALAHDLDVGLPAAGHLVTAFSVAYAIGAPVLAVLTAGWSGSACWLSPWVASPSPTCSPRWHPAMRG
jgi:predicted MFS family arabinose efflux permease